MPRKGVISHSFKDSPVTSTLYDKNVKVQIANGEISINIISLIPY
jgi:hypothetical protein